MIRPVAFLLVFVTCILFGCGGTTRPTPSGEVYLIGVEELCRIYRNHPKDATFKDRLIQCQLDPRTYRIHPGVIEAHWYATDLPGCVHFECQVTPKNDSKRLVVTGRVVGIVRDGVRREATTDYFVLVQSCSVTVLEP